MLLTARHVKTWVDRFGAALDTLHVVDAKAFGLPPDEVPNVLLRRTADLKHYCDYYFGGTVVPGKQSPTVFIIAGGWSAFRKQSKLPYSESISNRGLCGLLLNLGLLFSLHSRVPTNEGLPELVIEYLRPHLE